MTTPRKRFFARPPWLASALALLIAGCGQRGDLYLPAPQKTAVPPDAAGSADCSQPGSGAAKTSASGTGCTAPAN